MEELCGSYYNMRGRPSPFPEKWRGLALADSVSSALETHMNICPRSLAPRGMFHLTGYRRRRWLLPTNPLRYKIISGETVS